MAAIFAASKGVDTWLLERTADGGRKILISGGGRCNILPTQVDESRFVTDSSPHTLRRMVRSWPLGEQMAFFETELQLPLVAEAGTGKLFPRSQRARDVRDRLLGYARRTGVQILTNTLVTRIAPHEPGWIVERDAGDPLQADAVILATGGLSVPHTGSDGRGLEMASRLGHAIQPTYAALTPLRSTPTGYFWQPARRLAIRHDHRTVGYAQRAGHRWVSLHARGLQRPCRARCLARRRSFALRREPSGRDRRAMVGPE